MTAMTLQPHYRTVWISDVHLGTRGCQADLLLDFLNEVTADTYYLVGDIIDGWRLKKSWYWPESHHAVITTIMEKAKNGAKVIFVPGNHDEFAREFVDMTFGHVDVKMNDIHVTADGKRLLVIEDVQFLEGKSATQLEFFHTVQHVLDAGGKLMLTGDRMPQEMHQLSERIRSQLGSGFVAELEAPDAQVRRAILRNKAANGGVALPSDCLEELVGAIRGSVRDLEGALIQLVTSASLMKSRIDLSLTRKVIQQRAGTEKRERTLSPGDVVATVAGFFGVGADRISGRSRRREILIPRQVAMYLSKQLTTRSLPEIGRKFGGRDHTTVIHAVRKIDELCQVDSGIEEDVDLLRRMLEGGHGPN